MLNSSIFFDCCGLPQHLCHDLAPVRPLSSEEQQHQLSKVFGNVMGEMWDYCLTNALTFLQTQLLSLLCLGEIGRRKDHIEVLVIGVEMSSSI
jgi:hypothetical protein